MKPLLPTLRERKRYLVYEVITKNKITKEAAEKAIKESLKEFLGDYGMAKAGIIFLKDWQNNRGIIKINHKEVDKVKSALTLVKKINNKDVIIKSVGLSGIIKKARLKYMSKGGQ